MARKDLLTRLADRGEEAIGRLADAPGGDRLLGVANSMRDRMDELQKRVLGIDELEGRVEELEGRVEELSGGRAGSHRPAAQPRPPRRPAARRPRGSTRPLEAGTDLTEPEAPEGPGETAA